MLTELHNGTIEAFSRGLGHGCIIEVRLPLAVASPSEFSDELLKENEEVPETDSLLPRYRIVVVDNDRSMRFLTSRLLQDLNQSVTVADSGESAMDTIVRIQPKVVFLDLNMDGVSGYAVAREVRSRADLNHVILVALSGSADSLSRRQATESGFDQYLVKPASVSELSEVLKRASHHRSAMRKSQTEVAR